MKRLRIKTTGPFPGPFSNLLSELDYLIHTNIIEYWKHEDGVISIYGPDISSMASTVDYVKQQPWFKTLSFKCLTTEEYLQEKS